MKPTLEEVKEYFKDAEMIEATNSSQKFKVNVDLFEIDDKGFVNEYVDGRLSRTNGTFHCVYDGVNYAKILTYKEQKFEITKEQILKLSKYTSLANDWFPEVFKKELEVGKWYTPCNRYEGIALLYCDNPENKHNCGYGFDFKGE